jgi:hypothetical protein
MPARSPEDRALIARIAAQARWAKEDPAEQGAKMRAGLEQRWLREVDPDGVLPQAERFRRAESAKRAHMNRMALRSAQVRRSCGPAE